jgi:hypothetical protein
MKPELRLGARVRVSVELAGIRGGAVGLVDEITSRRVFVSWGTRGSRDNFEHLDARRLLEVIPGPSCGVPWGVCPHDPGQGLAARGASHAAAEVLDLIWLKDRVSSLDGNG